MKKEFGTDRKKHGQTECVNSNGNFFFFFNTNTKTEKNLTNPKQ